jgi:pyruvate/2-oxoglutarate dehydrogenase complex dihydrolipoamide dehydrogenase (E3) component
MSSSPALLMSDRQRQAGTTLKGYPMSETFDSIVIGAGQAGPGMAARLAASGERVALIERDQMGGTCVNTGCTPTKTLVASAHAAWLAREGERYGIMTGPVTVDAVRVRARKDAVVLTSRGNVTRWMENTAGITVIHGHARFTGAHMVAVDGKQLQAARIFVNVGAKATVPPVPGIETVPYMTNADVMDMDVVPDHLVILGGSYISLEFAQIYRRFGAEVTILEAAPEFLGREDADIAAQIHGILTGEGIRIEVGITDLSFAKSDDGISAHFRTAAGRDVAVTGSHLLVATGRRPNTDDLGLDAAGLAADRRGVIPVDETCRSAQPHIWVLGDANGRGAFTHTAYNDFEIVAGNLLDGENRKISDRKPVYALFIDPPLGRIGMTEAEARAAGHRVLVGTRTMARVGRAVEAGETRGMMKIIFDAETRRLLGAAIIGFHGDEAVQFLLPALYQGLTDHDILTMTGIHPTVTELLPYAIADAKEV